MAKAKSKSSEVRSFIHRPKKKRPGVHAKKQSSKNKKSKFYKKINRGQG